MKPRFQPALSAFGLELEVLLVDSDSLTPAAGADVVLRDACGGTLPSVQMGATEWRRRPAAHELTVATPATLAHPDDAAVPLGASLRTMAGMLAPHGLQPLGGGLHPWYDVRNCADRGRTDDPTAGIFDVLQQAGAPAWAEARAAVLSFPFLDDEDFRPLYAALRLIVPILPALAAASPLRAGRRGPTLDERIATARNAAAAWPEFGGHWYPEGAFGVRAYREVVLTPLGARLAELHAGGRLPADDFNARALVARFGPRVLQMRAADLQECPAQDVAIAAAVVETARALVRGDWLTADAQEAVADSSLAALGDLVLTQGLDVPLPAATLYGAGAGSSAREIWAQLLPRLDLGPTTRAALDLILREGTLAERMLRSVGDEPDDDSLRALVAHLASCAVDGRPFAG